MIEVEMEPGDVLLHDVMVVHGSPPIEGKALRRAIYYEFRAAEQIIAEGSWDLDWVDRRLRLVPPALRRYDAAYPEADRFAWHVSDEFRPEPSGDEEVELKVAHTAHTMGSFCSAGSVPPKDTRQRVEVQRSVCGVQSTGTRRSRKKAFVPAIVVSYVQRAWNANRKEVYPVADPGSGASSMA